MNLSTPRPEGWGLLKVHPEPRPFTPSLKTGLRAAERVNFQALNPKLQINSNNQLRNSKAKFGFSVIGSWSLSDDGCLISGIW